MTYLSLVVKSPDRTLVRFSLSTIMINLDQIKIFKDFKRLRIVAQGAEIKFILFEKVEEKDLLGL